MLCYICYKRSTHTLAGDNPRNYMSLEKALNKTYEVNGYLYKKKNTIKAGCSFPIILIGHKFKITLLDSPDEDTPSKIQKTQQVPNHKGYAHNIPLYSRSKK